MPLKKGTSKATVSSNVKTLVHEWENDGKIGNSHPDSKKKAVKQAVAISLKKAGKSRSQMYTHKKEAQHQGAIATGRCTRPLPFAVDQSLIISSGCITISLAFTPCLVSAALNSAGVPSNTGKVP